VWHRQADRGRLSCGNNFVWSLSLKFGRPAFAPISQLDHLVIALKVGRVRFLVRPIEVKAGVVEKVFRTTAAPDVEQSFHLLFVGPLLLFCGQPFDCQNGVSERLQYEIAVTASDAVGLAKAAISRAALR
jgi:hypothetical protein